MPDKTIEKILLDLNNELFSKFDNFEGIYLYGSRAKGNFRHDSDFDIIVLFKDDYSLKIESKLAEIIINIELKYDIFIDYHPMTLKELERNPVFYNEVVNKGSYYEAA